MELHFTEKPALNKPTLIAAWPGMGMLARMSADFLIQQLGAKLFAEIRSPSNDIYFNDGVGEISHYLHRFYYKKREQGDLIICSGEIQPQTINGIYELANKVLDVAEKFGTKQVYTFAAVPNPQDVAPSVFGVVNQPKLKDFLKENDVTLVSGEGKINGLNGLLVGVAHERKMNGICLLGEIRYLDVPQPRTVKAVLATLMKILDLKLDLTDLEQQADEIEKKLAEIRERRSPEATQPREPRYIS
jgi:proteasome assembly chaperone (PAC2) family protein